MTYNMHINDSEINSLHLPIRQNIRECPVHRSSTATEHGPALKAKNIHQKPIEAPCSKLQGIFQM